MKKLICFFLFFFSLNSFSQEIDTTLVRLKKEINNSKNDSTKIVYYLRLNRYYHFRDLKKADSLLNKILIMLDTVDYDSRIHRGQIYSRKGIISRIRSDYPASLRNYDKAKAIYEEINDTLKLIYINNNIGNLYSYQYDYKTAYKYFKESININRKPYKEQLGISYRLLAGDFYHRKVLDSTFYYLNKARIIFKEVKSKFEYFASNNQLIRYSLEELNRRDSLMNSGKKYSFKKLNEIRSYKDLMKIAEETTSYFQKAQHKHYLSESYLNLTKINFKLKKYLAAEKYANTTIDVANQIEKKHLKSKTYELKSMINERIGRFKNALEDYKQYEELKSEIYTEKKSKEIIRIEVENEFAKKKLKDSILFVKQKEILVLEKDKVLAQNKFIGLSSIIGLIIAFFIIRLLRKKWLIQRKLSKQIEEKLEKTEEKVFVLNSDKQKLTKEVNELLTETLIHLNTKERLAEDLLKLSQEKGDVTLKGIIADLKADKLEDSKILVLKKNIETLNFDFLENLKQRHPNLTKTDIEVCSFIKIGFSRKEISNLRKTSLGAIKTTKFRLKKKLKLEANQSLDEYIKSI